MKKITTCKHCSKPLTETAVRKYFCSEDCFRNFKLQKAVAKSLDRFPEGTDYVECAICGYRGKALVAHLTKFHKMSTAEYKEKYNSPTASKSTLNKLSSNMSGEKNPWYNHGGKLSPYKKGSVNYSEEAIKKANKNRSYNTRLEYYTDKGYSEEEAAKILHERQRTFTLEKCIARYGEEKGKEVFADRQRRWPETLNSKSAEEKERIFKLKSNGFQKARLKLFPELLGKKAYLYYIRLYNKDTEVYKIGITKNLDTRMYQFRNKSKLNLDLLFVIEDVYEKCFQMEQDILDYFRNYRKSVKYNDFSSAECFNENILEGVS